MDFLRAEGLKRCPKCKRLYVCNTSNFPFLLKAEWKNGKKVMKEEKRSNCWSCANLDPKEVRALSGLALEKVKKKLFNL